MGLFNRATKPDWSTDLAHPQGNGSEPSPELDVPVAPELVEEPVAEASPAEHEIAEEPSLAEEDVMDEPQAEPPAAEQEIVDSEPQAEPPAAEQETADPEPESGDSGPEAAATPSGENGAEPDSDDENRISAQQALSPSRRAGDRLPGAKIGDEAERRVKIISFANQKGGVAKTTTTLNLAVAFAESGHRVLAVDLDPQGNLTMSQGIDPDQVETSMYDVLVDHIPIRDVIAKREIDIAVASIDLAGAEIAMSMQIGRERSLEKALSAVIDDYDFVCIDTPPSLGLLTVNALTASDKVIVPVQCEYLSMRGLIQLQNTLEMIRENLNPRVQIEGILPTMLDSRTVHAKEAIEILEENFGELVFKSRIRKAIKFAEAPVRGASVLKYDPKGNAAKSYRDLAEEVLTHGAS
jgi:chromosome partitioning protein